MTNYVNIAQLVRDYMQEADGYVHIDDIVHDLSPRISVNQACRIWRSYHKGAEVPRGEVLIRANSARKREIRVKVRELTRKGYLTNDGQTYRRVNLS